MSPDSQGSEIFEPHRVASVGPESPPMMLDEFAQVGHLWSGRAAIRMGSPRAGDVNLVGSATPRVIATSAALEALADLVASRGLVALYQSGPCCEGGAPLCFDEGELIISARDACLGEVGGCAVYIDGRHFESWKHCQLILDVADGDPSVFSLPARAGQHFVSEGRVLSDYGVLDAIRWGPRE